ncbi:hypothetical protein CYY_004199 [Polysphondylium violaceum]|uniref:Uncharacterized protein n=1 Tax=Polysphondylium violaceum TaxID=133409 RepID=A0A8J4PXD5_9MYCE|nr:hypothetical protein CYY_004199 [Polysphondylium violaceum]
MNLVNVIDKSTRFKNFCKKNSKYFLYLDIGATKVEDEPYRHRSKIGVLVSLVIFVILLFYIVVTISQFSKGVPTIIYSSLVASRYLPFPTPPLGILLRDKNNQETFDSRYYSVRYNYITIRNQDALPRVKVPLATVQCTFMDNENPQTGTQSIFTENAHCPNETVMMSGTYEMSTYNYLEIELRRCICAVPNDPTCTCASDAEFVENFFQGSVSLLVTEQIPTTTPLLNKISLIPENPDLSAPPKQVSNIKSMFWKSITPFYYKVDVFIRKQTIFNGPRYIFDYHYNDFYYVGKLDPKPEDYDSKNTTLFKAYIRLDSSDEQEIRQSPQVLQLIGSWGALYSFFALTFIRGVRVYNRKLYNLTTDINNAIKNLLHRTPSQVKFDRERDKEFDINNNNVNSSPPTTTIGASSSPTILVGDQSPVQKAYKIRSDSDENIPVVENNNNNNSQRNSREMDVFHRSKNLLLHSSAQSLTHSNLDSSWELPVNNNNNNNNNISLSSMSDLDQSQDKNNSPKK